MSSTLTLSLLQHVPTPGDLKSSVDRIEFAASKARAEHSALLVVPEASMTGYNISLNLRNQMAEPLDGALTDSIAAICRQHDLAVSYGFIEAHEDQFYNTVQLINRSGVPVAHYRKTHLWGDLDRRLFSPGESLTRVVDIDGWKIGLLICYDVEFPETVRHHALQGADLVLVSTALMTPWTNVADRVVPTRAGESQVFVAYANYCGSENGVEYVGHSCVAGPDGSTLVRASDDEAMITAILDKASMIKARESLPYLRDRRPALYGQLVDECNWVESYNGCR